MNILKMFFQKRPNKPGPVMVVWYYSRVDDEWHIAARSIVAKSVSMNLNKEGYRTMVLPEGTTPPAGKTRKI